MSIVKPPISDHSPVIPTTLMPKVFESMEPGETDTHPWCFHIKYASTRTGIWGSHAEYMAWFL